ncbi:MAG: hypothetical protein JSW61_15235 [Candidatus Thorarchaeota archaeon]|nr:MAG: hypothetical protein JSW61_15235 [Candidatus Thorarchaeota archaeon]
MNELTTLQSIQLVCPNCSTQLSIVYPASICTWLNPDMVRQLLTREGFSQQCEGCGSAIHLQGHILVNAPSGMFWMDLGLDMESRRRILFQNRVIDDKGNVVQSGPDDRNSVADNGQDTHVRDRSEPDYYV